MGHPSLRPCSAHDANPEPGSAPADISATTEGEWAVTVMPAPSQGADRQDRYGQPCGPGMPQSQGARPRSHFRRVNGSDHRSGVGPAARRYVRELAAGEAAVMRIRYPSMTVTARSGSPAVGRPPQVNVSTLDR